MLLELWGPLNRFRYPLNLLSIAILLFSLENESRIDVLDIDDIFKIINDNLTEEFTILPIDKSIEETIEEFQKYLENQ
jgi:hypothetical protein